MIAPLCRDEIVRGESRSVRAGGAGLYMTWALSKLGVRVHLHTPLAESDRDLLDALPSAIEVTVHPSRETMRFRLTLDPHDPDRRSLECQAMGGSLDPAKLDLSGAGLILLGPLLPTDLSADLCLLLRQATVPIDLGVQGLVRSVAENGSIRLARRVHRADLPPIRILAGDDDEIARVRGIRSRETLVTRASRGAVVQLEESEREIVIPPVPLADAPRNPVGLGDTFLAVYSWWRHSGLGVADAGARAAEAASHLLCAGP